MAAEFGEELRRWERMREDVEFCLLENVRSYLRISASAAGGSASELIYCAAVEKNEDQRKPDDFFGHRKRGGQIPRSGISLQ